MGDPTYELICAVRGGGLQKVRELTNTYNLSYSKAWSDGYILLRDAVENNHIEIAKLLLVKGCKVKSKKKQPSNTPLHFAARNGNIEIVEMLLSRSVDVNAKNKSGCTPLHNAIGNDKITELLLNHGADVNATDDDGATPLLVAVRGGCVQTVEYLLTRGAYINCRFKSCRSWGRPGYTPLHLAVEDRSEKVINLLLIRGANVDAKSDDATTPLHIAVGNASLEIVQQLLKHGANVNNATSYELKEGYTPLHLAADKGSEDIILLLLSCNADINASAKDNSTPLHNAAKNGHGKIVELLLDHGANVDAQDKNGNTVLYYAAKKGHSMMIEYILKYFPDVNNKNNKSSLYAAVHGSIENKTIVENLIDYGFSVNPEDVNDCKLLHNAVEKGYLKIVEDLLKYNADVNMIYSLQIVEDIVKGSTLIHAAVKSKRKEAATLSINNGAHVNIYEYGLKSVKSVKCSTLLHTAVINKQEEVATLLINYGADVNAKDESGNTPIIYAIMQFDFELTKLLLINGANVIGNHDLLIAAVKSNCIEIVKHILQEDVDINASDKNGRTALHYTSFSEYHSLLEFPYDNKDPDNNKGEIAKLLLSKGANVNAQAKDGMTTLFYAVEEQYTNVVAALLEYNANVNLIINDTTPLRVSVEKGNVVISKMLLDKGANVNAKYEDGITALHIATQKGHEGLVEILLNYGAKVESKLEHGVTPIHLAALKGFLEIIEILLKFGADINSTDKRGRTALHIASKEGHDGVIRALLDSGSDINIETTINYCTPLDFAEACIYNNSRRYDFDDVEEYFFDIDRCISDEEYLIEDRFTICDIILKQHIIKLWAADLYLCEQNLRTVMNDEEYFDLKHECDLEIQILKSEKINCNVNVTFYDILTKSTSQLAIYARNENIVQVLKSDDYKTKFPLYACMISNNFRKGVERKEVLEQGIKSFHTFCNSFCELPHNCTEQIFNYLSNNDMKSFINACKLNNN